MRDRWLPPELPQLVDLLDPVVVRQAVSSELLGSVSQTGSDLIGCRLSHLRYRPGKNSTLTWHGRGSGGGEIWFSLLVCRHGESRQDYEAAVDADGPPDPDRRPGVFHLPELNAVLRLFPLDRRLRGMAWLDRPSQLIDQLTGVPGMVANICRRPEPDVVRPDVVRYIAERSCTIRVTGDAGAQVVYAKFYRPRESARVWERINDLWRCQTGIAIPEPLAWHPASESVWIGALDGTPLSEDLTADRWQEIGQTLAAFHRIQPPATIPVGPAVSADLRMKIPHLAAVQPELRSRLADLAAKLIGGEPPAREDNATLHGDLHLKNLIALPDGRIGLIDLDNLKQGDPLIDLGSFVAYLYYRRLAAGLPAETAADEIAELSQGYTHGAGQPIDLARLRFRTAVALLTERAWRSLTRLRPDVGAMIENIVDLAERLVMR